MKFKGFLKNGSSYPLLRHTRLNWYYLRSKIKRLGVDRLHIGCGDVLVRGWLNIGLDLSEEYGRIKDRNGALFLNYNLLKQWPVEENVITYVAASHFIEHFDLNRGLEFMRKAFKVLKSTGVIRLSCPDLEVYAKNYAQNNKTFYEHPLIREWCAFKNAKTPGEIFAAKAYDSGGAHKWFYDFASLKHILEEAGFRDVSRKQRLEGLVPDLEKIELEKRELETVYVEAVKP